MSSVRPEFRPTLPELLRPRWRAASRGVRAAAALVLLVLVLVVLWALLLRGEDEDAVILRGQPEANFIYDHGFRTLAPAEGERVRVGAGGQSFSVRPLTLPSYRGDASGALPLLASRAAAEMAQRFDGFVVRQEGRANVNKVQGYQLTFQARRDGQTIYGQRVFLPETPTSTQGADLLLLAPRSTGVPVASAIGRSGGLKTTLRSFRFGTDRP